MIDCMSLASNPRFWPCYHNALTITANQPCPRAISLTPKKNEFQEQQHRHQKIGNLYKIRIHALRKGLSCVSLAVNNEQRQLNEKGTFKVPPHTPHTHLRNWFYHFRAASTIILSDVLFLLQISHSSFNGAYTICRELINLMTRKNTGGFLDFGLTSRAQSLKKVRQSFSLSSA